jgi:exosortase/archaeosortase family protein
MAISAVPFKSNRYKVAPIVKTKMPGKMPFQNKDFHRQRAFPYAVAAATIALSVYFIPNYFFLERATAEHAASLLNALGANVQASAVGQTAFLENIRVVKECTGIQVIAVFLGLLLPLPAAPWRMKLITLATAVASVYVANVLRIALEFWLVYSGMLPWSLAHYPMSLLLGIIGVAILVLLTDRLLPELGDFMLAAIRPHSG